MTSSVHHEFATNVLWTTAQVPCDVRYVVTVGGRRSAYCSAVARSFRYGEYDAIFEAVSESACAG